MQWNMENCADIITRKLSSETYTHFSHIAIIAEKVWFTIGQVLAVRLDDILESLVKSFVIEELVGHHNKRRYCQNG